MQRIAGDTMGLRPQWHSIVMMGFVAAALLSLLLAPLIATAADAKSSSAGARYKLVAGKGYSVCEGYLKHLNSLSPEEPPPICEIKLSPQYKNFRFPEWETLDWKEHLDWIYQIEQHLYHATAHDEALKRLNFAEWQVSYLARAESGRLKPRLRRAQVTLNERGPETMLDYDRRLGGCEESPPSPYGADGGSHYFVVIEGVPPRFERIESLTSHMILFGGRAYFMFFDRYGAWEADMYTVHPLAPEPYPGAPRYVMNPNYGKTCRYLPSKNAKD
jgi:hypothetical protein